MIPLRIGLALTIVIGFEVGAKHFIDARTYGYIGMSSGLFIAFFAGLVLYIFNDFVAALYNTNPEVIEWTKKFIYFAIFFQFSSAFDAPIQGALRGYKDINVNIILSLSFPIVSLAYQLDG